MMGFDVSGVSFAFGPVAVAVGLALRPFAVWLARFFGSWLMMGIAALVAEIIPRFLGLGQGLISWGMGLVASASFSAFQSALSMAGVSVPSFTELLGDLPSGFVWICSALRVHRIVFIMASVLLVKLFRRVLEAAASSAAKAGSLMSGGR